MTSAVAARAIANRRRLHTKSRNAAVSTPAPSLSVDLNWRKRQQSRRGKMPRARPHQLQEVVTVERLAHSLGRVAETALEAFDRSPAALDVGVVAVEQHRLGPRLLDDPADILGGIRRELHRAAD